MTKIDTTVNQLPALTWNWLVMNRANVQYEVDVKGSGMPSVSKLPDGVVYDENGAGIAMSLRPLVTGMGKNIDALLQEREVTPSILTIKRGSHIKSPVLMHFDLKNGSGTFSSQIIHAEDGSDVIVIMDYSSPAKSGGFQLIQTKVYCEKNARVHLVKVQMLGQNFIQLDDTGSVCEEGGVMDVTQLELGGKEIYAGVASSLTGRISSFKSDTAYLCRDNQKFDMNYVVTHTGRKTTSEMNVKGVVAGTAEKMYRGTIDFKNGCTGSTGKEQEETLILSPTAVTKSIPLILCDEENVEGEHGASIGRLDDNMLFYMNSRGIKKETAERMLSRAKIKSVARLIPDEKTIEKIAKYTDEVIGNE